MPPERDTYETLQQRLLALVLAAAALVSIAIVVAARLNRVATDDPLGRLYAPVFGLTFVLLSVITLAFKRTNQVIRYVLVAVFALGMYYRLGARLWAAHLDGDIGARLPAMHFHWSPLVFLLAFMVLPRKAALAASVGMYVLGAIMVGAFFHVAPVSFGDSSFVTSLALVYGLGHVIYAGMFYLMARMREVYEAARHDASAHRQMALTDALTGAVNRRGAEDALAELEGRASSGGPGFSVILVDLDHFKSINDRFGHGAGDAVLREATTRLRHGVRGNDLVARWGGEEFLLILDACPVSGARGLAERLRSSIEQSPFTSVGRVTASFGLAEKGARETPVDLLRRADALLYAAKAGGRNRIEG